MIIIRDLDYLKDIEKLDLITGGGIVVVPVPSPPTPYCTLTIFSDKPVTENGKPCIPSGNKP